MVYFPEQHLLYVSDTLSLDDHNVLYNPELMREVIRRPHGLSPRPYRSLRPDSKPWIH